MTKEIIVSDVKEGIHGVSSTGPWTLYSVTDETGAKYSTFSATYKDLIGKKIVIDVEEKESKKINPKTQKPYKNLVIVEQKKQKDGGIWSSQLVEKLFIKLDKLENMIRDLELVDPSESLEDIPNEDEIEPPF